MRSSKKWLHECQHVIKPLQIDRHFFISGLHMEHMIRCVHVIPKKETVWVEMTFSLRSLRLTFYKTSSFYPFLCLPSAPSGTCNLLCLNGGTCVLNARKQPKCRCQPNYGGERCELNQCRAYCQNGGTCTASPTGTVPPKHTIWALNVFSRV